MMGNDFIQQFEKKFPLALAEKGDPVGLHIGTLHKPIQRVMITLDVRPEVVAEAIAKKVDLLVAKHPPIFRPIDRLVTDDPQINMYADLLKHDIAVYAAHTNMDIVEDGLNDWFLEELGMKVTDYLHKTHEIDQGLIQVMVPKSHSQIVRDALAEAGAGKIGNYEQCSYTSVGTGRFTPMSKANPTIGTVHQREEVAEEKIEMVVPIDALAELVKALKESHPYEEPAYQVIPLMAGKKSYGIGRVGELPTPMPLEEFVSHVKEVFDLQGLRLIANDTNRLVQRVGICGGSGQKFYPAALSKGCDVYITGDVYYHTGHDMLTADLPVIDPGHYIEQLCIPRIVSLCEQWKEKHHWDIEIIPSTVNTNPFSFR